MQETQMVLKMRGFRVEDVRLRAETAFTSGVLTVSRKGLQALLVGDGGLFESVDVSLTQPSEKRQTRSVSPTRIVKGYAIPSVVGNPTLEINAEKAFRKKLVWRPLQTLTTIVEEQLVVSQ